MSYDFKIRYGRWKQSSGNTPKKKDFLGIQKTLFDLEALFGSMQMMKLRDS
jgi:hypothetical protein